MVITLDAGHTKGYNTVKYPGFTYSEGTRMFYYALALKAQLEKYGYKVVLTRENVSDSPNYAERAKIGADAKSDVFLSLHSNSIKSDPDKKGIVVCYSMHDKPFLKPFGWAVAEADAAVMGSVVVDVYRDESKTYKGEDYFAILREAVRAGLKRSMIIEHGYHSNESEARWLSSDENLETLAKAEAKAIYDYLRENLKKTMYRVQVGSYAEKANAEKKVERLEADGFGGWIEQENGQYKVFAGSYEVYANAEKEVAKLKEKGYSSLIVEVIL